MLVGITFVIIGTSGIVYHIVIQVLRNPRAFIDIESWFNLNFFNFFLALLPVEQSNIIPIIWAFITLKSGVLLTYYVFNYKTKYNVMALMQDVETQTNDESQAEETEETKDDSVKVKEGTDTED